MNWRLAITPKVQTALKAFAPQTKRYLRQAFKEICQDPNVGKPLRDELSGFYSFPTRRFRVIYRLQRDHHTIFVVGVGRRENIYEELRAPISLGKLANVVKRSEI